MLRNWGITGAPESWAGKLEQLPWVSPKIREWMRLRLAVHGAPSAANTHTENIQAIFNLIPGSAQGYFDDGAWRFNMHTPPFHTVRHTTTTHTVRTRVPGIFLGHVAVVDALDESIFELMDLGVEAAWSKFERAYMNGTIASRKSRYEWNERVPGHMQVLGKLMILKRRILCDSEPRIAEGKALLVAILQQAKESPKRQVFVSALRRCLGVWIYITMQVPVLRTFLRGVIKALTKVGAWAHGCTAIRDLSSAWRMGQSAYKGASTLRSGDAAAIEVWLTEWQHMPLGRKTGLPRSCDTMLPALMEAVDTHNECVFLPRRSPSPAQSVIWLFHDSAGKSDEFPDSYRGCGCWMYCSEWTELQYMQEEWRKDVLNVTHSTAQESASGLANLDAAMHKYKAATFIEVYDSAATIDIDRSMASSSFEARKIVQARAALLAKFPNTRVLAFWQMRERGQIAGQHCLA